MTFNPIRGVRRLAVALALGAAAASPALAQSGFQQSISDYLGGGTGPAEVLYATDRCASLMLASIAVFSESHPLAPLLMVRGELFYTAGLNAYLEYHPAEVARERHLHTVDAFMNIYAERMSASYIATGHYTADEMIAADLAACGALGDQIRSGS